MDQKCLDQIDSVHIQFADKDYTNYNMPVVVPYSMYTVIDEFSKRPAVFTKGRMTFVEPISGAIDVDFPMPVGKVSCFYTLHSELASMPKKFASRGIRECSFRGGFDKTFVSYVKFLIDTGFTSGEKMDFGGAEVRPVDMTVKLLDRFLPPPDVKVNDAEMLRVALSGRKKGKRANVVMYCSAVTDRKWNIPAGSWDTGVPPSIIAQMITNKKIDACGVLTSDNDCVDSEFFFRMLSKRDMKVFETIGVGVISNLFAFNLEFFALSTENANASRVCLRSFCRLWDRHMYQHSWLSSSTITPLVKSQYCIFEYRSAP